MGQTLVLLCLVLFQSVKDLEDNHLRLDAVEQCTMEEEMENLKMKLTTENVSSVYLIQNNKYLCNALDIFFEGMLIVISDISVLKQQHQNVMAMETCLFSLLSEDYEEKL